MKEEADLFMKVLLYYFQKIDIKRGEPYIMSPNGIIR